MRRPHGKPEVPRGVWEGAGAIFVIVVLLVVAVLGLVLFIDARTGSAASLPAAGIPASASVP